MKNSSQSYKELGIPYFKEVFDLLDKTFKARGIPYYLLGATAIALELLKDGIKPARGTKDIDFAIMISSKSEYEAFTKDLEEKGFTKVTAPWTFRHPEFDIVIDILPFGEIEENYNVNFNQLQTDLHVLGFTEVMSESTQVKIEDILVNIPTLQGIIILKLIAWSDRPEERENDLGDILLIISKYYMLMWNHILENHFDLLEDLKDDGEKSQRLIASRVLGREAANILKKSEKVQERIYRVLEDNLTKAFESAIAKDWAIKLDEPVNYTLSLLGSFFTGIKEGKKNID
jgi:predicted nucleotidyltransferase